MTSVPDGCPPAVATSSVRLTAVAPSEHVASELLRLRELIRRVYASHGVRATADSVVDMLVGEYGFAFAALDLVRRDGDLETVATGGNSPFAGDVLGRRTSLTSWTELFEHATPTGPLFLVDRANAPHAAIVPFPAEPAGAPLCAGGPLIVARLLTAGGHLIGAVTVDPATPGAPPQERLAQLELFSGQVRFAIERSRLRDEVGSGPAGDVTLLARRLRALVRSAPVAIIERDLEGRVALWNPAAEQLFGWSAAEVLGNKMPTIPADLLDEYHARMERLYAGQPDERHEIRRIRKDGTSIVVDISSSALRDPSGQVTGVLSMMTDITQRLALQRGLQARERQQAAVATLGRRALGGLPLDRLFDEACAVVAETLDLCAAAVLRRLSDGRLSVLATAGVPLTHSRRRSPSVEALDSDDPVIVADLAQWSPSTRTLADKGLRSSASVVIGAGNRQWGVLEGYSAEPGGFPPDDVHFLQSVSHVLGAAMERSRIEGEILHQARHDSLTGLPNRSLLADRMTVALQLASRAGRSAALLLVDLNGFKEVNDTQGHAAGDRVLRQVSERLSDRMRAVDTVARLGGDEFAVSLGQLADPEDAVSVAKTLVELLARPFDTDGGPVALGGSVGIAIAPQHGNHVGVLLRHADLAMYRAKREHSGWALYDAETDETVAARLALAGDLRLAVDRHELLLAYQPVVDSESHEVTQVEALVRWQHPVRGLLGPAEFVPLAEQTGLIHGLTEWVLERAVRQAAAWNDAGIPLTVAVNVSGMSLSSPRISEQLDDLLSITGLPPERLTVEVTETALVREPARAALRRLRELGVRATVDDFGTGYSSLGYLKDLPVDGLKIDRNFVSGMVDDHRDAAIVRSVVNLAHELGLAVVAEGVETSASARLLRTFGAEHLQGYLISDALPAADVPAWLEAWRTGDCSCCGDEEDLAG